MLLLLLLYYYDNYLLIIHLALSSGCSYANKHSMRMLVLRKQQPGHSSSSIVLCNNAILISFINIFITSLTLHCLIFLLTLSRVPMTTCTKYIVCPLLSLDPDIFQFFFKILCYVSSYLQVKAMCTNTIFFTRSCSIYVTWETHEYISLTLLL